MDNKPTLTTLLIPNLDKPEYHNMTKTIVSFMEQREIKTITKALPALLADYELIKWRYEAEKEEHAKNNREHYEARKKLRERIDYLETGQHKIMEVFNHFLPTKP